MNERNQKVIRQISGADSPCGYTLPYTRMVYNVRDDKRLKVRRGRVMLDGKYVDVRWCKNLDVWVVFDADSLKGIHAFRAEMYWKTTPRKKFVFLRLSEGGIEKIKKEYCNLFSEKDMVWSRTQRERVEELPNQDISIDGVIIDQDVRQIHRRIDSPTYYGEVLLDGKIRGVALKKNGIWRLEDDLPNEGNE